MPLLEGKPIAQKLREEMNTIAEGYRAEDIIPTLAIIVATDDPQAAWYVRSIRKAAAACAIEAKIVELDADTDTMTIAAALEEAASNPDIYGIVLQTPLPTGVIIDELLPHIPFDKDIDGASPESAGRLSFGLPAFAPATAEAVMRILSHYKVPIAGKQAVVVGRSRIVGKPVAQLLLAQDATVTMCHSRSTDLASITKTADILVAAAGKPGLITPNHVKPGAAVIDVGTTVTKSGELAGDVRPAVADIAAVTPVPGGVGPVTTTLILQHTLTAVAERQSKK